MPSTQFDLLLAVKSQGAPQVAADIKGIGTAAQGAANQTNTLPQSFAKVTQTANGMNSTVTKTQQVMGATVTTTTNATKAAGGWTTALKSNIFAISGAAAGIIGMVASYTQLQRAQVMAARASVADTAASNRVIDIKRKLGLAIDKYGASSAQAAKLQRDLSVAEERATVATERHRVTQEIANERMAEFAINIIPQALLAVGGLVQTITALRGAQEAATTVTTIEGEATAVMAAQQELAATGALALGEAQDVLATSEIATAGAADLAGTAQETAAAMEVTAKVGASELAVANDTLAASEVAAGEAATAAGISMRTALIRTGIGALLVAAGTALLAFSQNWWGFRDAVNAAGVALGKFMPQLKPVLDFLNSTIGVGILRLFGVDIPDAAGKTTDAMGDVGEGATAAAKEAEKAAEDISKAWQDTLKDLTVMPGADKKDWKEQFKKLSDLGFGKKGIHELKDLFFKPAGVAQAITSNIKEALQIVGQTKGLLTGDAMRKLSNNLIDQLNKGIKDSKGQLDFLTPLIDIIRAHKKDPKLGQLVAEWFAGLPDIIKQKLKQFGIDPDEIIKGMGFDPAAIAKSGQAALKASFQTPAFTNAIGDVSDWILGTKGATTTTPKLQEQAKGWAADIIAGLQKTFTVENLSKVGTAIMNGILTAPTNILAPIAKFMDPIIAGMLNFGIQELTVAIPDWISRTFTAENFLKGLGMVKDLGSQFITGLWAIISDPVKTATEINKFVTNTLGAIGAWFVKNMPSTAATVSKAFENAQAWFGGLLKAAIDVASTIPSTVGAWILQKASDAFEGALNFGNQLGAKIKEGVLAGLNAEANWLLSWFKLQTAEGGGPGPTTTTPPGPGGGHKVLTQDDLTNLQGDKKNVPPGTTPPPTTTPTPTKPTTMPVVDQTAFQKGLQVAINNAAQTVVLISAEIKKIGSLKIPAVDEASLFQKGLQLAINNAAQTVAFIDAQLKKVSSIKVPTPNESTYQKGLQLAIDNAAQTVEIIDKTLKKISNIKVPAPNEKTYQKGLQLAIDNAGETVQIIEKTLKKIGNIKVPGPDASDFHQTLQAMKNDAANTVSAIKSTLSKVPGKAKGGLLSFAGGGEMFTSSHEQLVKISDNPGQRETVAFIPHNDPFPTISRILSEFGFGGGGGGGGNITINHTTRIDGNGIINERELFERFTVNLGGTQRMGRFKH